MTELWNQAQALGFARMRILRPVPMRVVRAHPHTLRLVDAPFSLMPDARALILLAYPYRPYRWRQDEPKLDAYYPASNAAHQAVRELAQWLREQGHAAISDAVLPLKPMAARCGLGRYGRNSLIAADSLGSRISLQMILTNAPLQCDPTSDDCGLSPECGHCDACVRACPTGALDGTGRVDLKRCLRAQPESEPVREELRLMMGQSLLGCDLCQRACPRNRAVDTQEPPQALREALDPARLLSDGHRALADYLGSNNARRMRINARGALIAAALRRRDLLDALTALTNSENEAVREHSRWAVQYLTKLP